MDETVSPIEAGMNFAIGKSRREAGDYLGADRISKELAGDLKRVRVNLRVLEGAPAREGAEIADETGAVVGVVTSGGFGPSVGGAIAIGFAPPAWSASGRS
jgi:aminomethyltransferase